jgi:hypothetical protein
MQRILEGLARVVKKQKQNRLGVKGSSWLVWNMSAKSRGKQKILFPVMSATNRRSDCEGREGCKARSCDNAM